MKRSATAAIWFAQFLPRWGLFDGGDGAVSAGESTSDIIVTSLSMAEAEQRRIFVSYARRDGADLAVRLQGDLTAAGFEVWLDTQRIRGGESWSVAIEGAIDLAQVVLAVLTQGSYESSICRAEQLRSLRMGKAVIPVLAQTDANRPLYLEGAHYRDFSVAGGYAEQLRVLIGDIEAGPGAVELRPEFRLTPHGTVPPLPRNFLERPEELASLRDAVLADDPGPGVALTALRGMGGIGKTVLAQALCHDAAVQQAFPDGIAWTTVGQQPAYNLITRIQDVRRALGDRPEADESELYCINRYRTLLREKAALVVVDDVWRSGDIEPFLAESPRSKILFTTRDGAIANATGARAHPAELLSAPHSRALLARWAQCDAGALPRAADALVDECGRLPLALSMVGAMVRGKPVAYWSHVLKLLRQADLEKIRAQFPSYPHADMLRAIQVSVDALDGVARRSYLALAVVLEDMTIAPAVQQTLWNVDRDGALEASERFVELSLAQRDGDDGGIRLHDLQLDYVRALFGEREALGLIHGAARLSAHVIERDAGQFASQMVGRLLGYGEMPAIRQFIDEVSAGAPQPWLRPLHPALDPPGAPLLRTLAGHTGRVCGVGVTPDGRWAVSASDDYTLKVWNLENGRALRTLEGHASSVAGVAVTPDGTRAVSASDDKTLKVWDLECGVELQTLEGHSDSVKGVAVTPDGKRAVSASADKTLKVWDLDRGRALSTLEGHASGVAGVAVTPDGQRVVSASWDSTLKVWDLRSGRELRTLAGHSNSVIAVVVTPDGQQAVSASYDNTLKVWDLETGRVLRTLVGHSYCVTGVGMMPDGRRAVSASWDHTLKVWDLETGRALHTLAGHSDSAFGVAVAPDGQRAVSASWDKTLKVWALESGSAPRTLEGHSSIVNGVAATADGKRVVSASSDRTLKVWDLVGGGAPRTLKGHTFYVNGVAVTPDGKRAVSASSDNTLKVWDLVSGGELHTLKVHSASVAGVAVTPDGQRAISVHGDAKLRVWCLESGRELRTLESSVFYDNGVAVTPDGERAVSASFDTALRVWDLESGRVLRTLIGHAGPGLGVAVTPDGQRAVSASTDTTLKVWDLESGRELFTLKGHSREVHGVAVTPDGKRVVSASSDNTLRVWDLGRGLLAAIFYCDAPARCCAFVDNRRIVAGDANGRVHFLSLELGDDQ